MALPNGMTPRPYQYDLFHMIRDSFRTNRAVLAESPTGSGKSIVMSNIVDSFLEVNKKWKKDRHLYFLVDELFLLEQFADHLEKWKIRHDIIGAGKKEGRSVNVHVCTIQTLRKRPPEKYPALIIVDEAHFSTSPSYMNLFYAFPESKILGLTASPETGSGKGLAADWVIDESGNKLLKEDGTPENNGNGIFDIMVNSPVTMRELTELGYLSPVKYFGVPIRGIENLHMNQGDYKLDEVEKLLKERGTFGDSIREMKKFQYVNNHIIFFCKSVVACYEMETILNSYGYTAEVLEGRLTKTERKRVMKNFSSGITQILVTCKLVLKGVDLPFLLMAVDLAPTPSRGTLRQKIGRGTRPAPGKTHFIYLDMVGNHRCLPGSDIYAQIDWNFKSQKYNKKPSTSGEENTCPLCYALIPVGKVICPECGADKPPPKKKKEKHMDGDLVEIVPVPLSEREGEDRAEVQARINKSIVDSDLAELIKIGLELYPKNKVPYWVYHKMTTKIKVVDVPLVYRIQRQMGYNKGWAFFTMKRLKMTMKLQELDDQISAKRKTHEDMVNQLLLNGQGINSEPLKKLGDEIKKLEIERLDWKDNWKEKR